MITIVDDDVSFLRALARFIRSLGHEVAAFASAEEFLGSPGVARTRVLISDVQMPGMSGLDLQERLKQQGHSFPIIFVASDPHERARGPALAAGALAFLGKPFREDELASTLRQALAPR